MQELLEIERREAQERQEKLLQIAAQREAILKVRKNSSKRARTFCVLSMEMQETESKRAAELEAKKQWLESRRQEVRPALFFFISFLARRLLDAR